MYRALHTLALDRIKQGPSIGISTRLNVTPFCRELRGNEIPLYKNYKNRLQG